MTRKAYVLIQVEVGSTHAVASSLRGIKGVLAADVVTAHIMLSPLLSVPILMQL